MIDGLSQPMTGEGCSAEPMTEAHREMLREACAEDPGLWEIYYASYAPKDFDKSFDTLMARTDLHLFAFHDRASFVGMSCFLNIYPDRQTLEIGSTYWRPSVRRTGFNRRAKIMMLARAFDCGFRRVEFRVDKRNVRSQGAMKKLGAVREGVLRAERVNWNDHIRDTVLFAILRDEWPR